MHWHACMERRLHQFNKIKAKGIVDVFLTLDKYYKQTKCHAKKILSPISTANAAISVTHSQLENDGHRNSMFMHNSHGVHL